MKNECRRNLGLNTNIHGLKNFVLTPIIRAKQRFVSRTHSLCTSTHIVAQSHMYYCISNHFVQSYSRNLSLFLKSRNLITYFCGGNIVSVWERY